MTAGLATEGLNKSFGSLVVASDIAFSLPKGERYALIGPNGAGKTTLINLLTGMLKPDAGQILLDGDDISAQPPAARVRRGLVRTFQINSLFPKITALDAVTLAVCERRGEAGVWWRGLSRYGEAVDEAHTILTSLRLDHVERTTTKELAYGQQRLLEIALALATKPKVLLLDEPAAGVENDLVPRVIDLIRGLVKAGGRATFLVEHNVDLVREVADQVCVLQGGHIIAAGAAETVLGDETVIREYLGRVYNA